MLHAGTVNIFSDRNRYRPADAGGLGLQPRRVNSRTRKGFWLPHASRGAVPPKKLQAALGLLTRLTAYCREASQFACPQI
jgi:hypothetical protein